ncbi:MlaC/ttg2D family ABC transporter substrate-binding protein [Pseudooceanicola sp. 502str34]|uniref:MlaC/ttg2D family ABC transporter substrate-binding protein n=1 Tax=Maritimibacter alkaliphilus TaxID=404236 RepID=UPI001C97A04A|nr:ABC transporter substrate-binding protein [Maritimibacter alkaliphilus]MBY6090677.1 ABC transporter substrate-binding protein [Maritimibacter alkaliphilus]
MIHRFNSRPSRRAVLAGLAGSAFALAAAPAFALTDAQAKSLVDGLVGEINKVIGSGASEAQMISQFERIFARYADVNVIARSTLGADARSFSNAQLAAFTDAFSGYISRKYGKRFREFIGGRIEVNEAKQVKTWTEVSATAYLRGEAPFEVKFFVSDRSGSNRFFDMVIEGVSMRLSERTEIGSMLDANGGDIGKLTAQLQRAG